MKILNWILNLLDPVEIEKCLEPYIVSLMKDNADVLKIGRLKIAYLENERKRALPGFSDAVAAKKIEHLKLTGKYIPMTSDQWEMYKIITAKWGHLADKDLLIIKYDIENNRDLLYTVVLDEERKHNDI